MENNPFDKAQKRRGNPAVEPFSAADKRRAAYLDPSPLAAPEARFRTKSGIPLNAGVVPKPPIPTGSAAIPVPTPPEGASPNSRAFAAADTAMEKPVEIPQRYAEEARRDTRAAAAAAVARLHDSGLPPPPPPSDGLISAVPSDFTAIGSGPYHDAAAQPDAESNPLHTTLVGVIVIASIVAGLGSSLWLSDKDKNQQARAKERAAVIAKAPAGANAAGAAGVAPDGRPGLIIADSLPRQRPAVPDETEIENPPLAAMVPSARKPAPAAQPSMQSGQAAEQSAPSQTPDDAARQSVSDRPDIGKSVNTTASSQAASAPQPAGDTASGSPAKSAQMQAAEQPAPSAARKKKSRKVTAARRPPEAVARRDRNEEIDRLKSQAFSETSRDRIGAAKSRRKQSEAPSQAVPQPGTSRTGPAPASARVGALRQQLAQCERNGNFFSREQCKWRLCDGKWGQQGCPSFETKSAAY